MTTDTFQNRVETTGRFIFDKIEGEKPSLFKKSWWQERVLNWSMKNPEFKTQLFYFVDVFPTLKKDSQVIQHIREYFKSEDNDMAAFLKLCAGTAGFSAITAKLASKVMKSNIEAMARQFIVGQNPAEAIKHLELMRKKHRFSFTADVLGELVLSEKESTDYADKYIELLQVLAHAANNWTEDPLLDVADYGNRPKVNISIKTSALYSQFDPLNFEGTIENVLEKLRPILRQAKALNCSVTLDAEHYEFKTVNLELFKRIFSEDEFKDMSDVGIVIQAYLLDAEKDLNSLLEWTIARTKPINIRLVKGAYWDFESMNAHQKNWTCPVFAHKAETDANYEKLTRFLFENRENLRPAFGTHNIRNIAFAIELAKEMHIPQNSFEFQMLYGMAEPFKKVLADMGYCVRNYSPVGDLIPGMAYLVRRLLENTANEGFLKQSFVDEKDYSELLQNPLENIPQKPEKTGQTLAQSNAEITAFQNESLLDFSRHEIRDKFRAGIKAVKDKYYGRKHGMILHGKEIGSEEWYDSINPSHPDEVVGRTAMATIEDAKHAVESAKQAFEEWSQTPAEKRAEYIFDIASILRRKKFELAAIEVCEAGKNWREADADVAEAIDFCEYYGREMLKLGKTQKMGNTIGELNQYFYQAKGAGVVIGPWNFPLAIPVGMAIAAVVTGNTVVLKPAHDTPIILAHFMQVIKEAKLPAGVINFLPGSGIVIGDYLVEHPDVKFITFTGSMEIGLRILDRAGKINHGQTTIKSVIAEMGGKNAIIVDEDADLDSAIKGIIHSAFGFQGQKCSAASRVIVLENIYKDFTERFVEAVKNIPIGPAEDPSAKMGPVINKKRKEEILRCIEKGKQDATLLIQKEYNGDGFYVPITVFGDVHPDSSIAQDEIFGPVTAIIKATNFDQALEIANGTKFALTGGVYSRSPENIGKAYKKFQVGNLYINRPITGALVYKQPFGGHKMSGAGAKAGGPDYLLHFLEAKSVSENTFRSGFAPNDN